MILEGVVVERRSLDTTMDLDALGIHDPVAAAFTVCDSMPAPALFIPDVVGVGEVTPPMLTPMLNVVGAVPPSSSPRHDAYCDAIAGSQTTEPK